MGAAFQPPHKRRPYSLGFGGRFDKSPLHLAFVESDVVCRERVRLRSPRYLTLRLL